MSYFDDMLTAERNRRAQQDGNDMAQLVTLTKALGVSRDYRKECWIAAATACAPEFPNECVQMADKALAAFDKRFPPL